MSKIKGQDLVVLFYDETSLSWKAVAFATDCELDENVTMLETGSQDSGNYAEFKPKKIYWRVTSAHLMSDVTQPVDFHTLIKNRTKFKITFTQIASHPDPSTEPPQYTPLSGGFARTGYAFVQRNTITARHRTFVTSSVELQGTGPLDSGSDDGSGSGSGE